MTKPIIGLLGGSGFVGKVLANRLVESGYAVRILTRRRGHARELWLLPDTHVVEVDMRAQEQLNEACSGCHAIINLAGILNERRDNGDGFHQVHVELTRRVAKACKAADVSHLIQMSAINADSFAASYYLRSKGEAEKLLGDEDGKRLAVTIMRPSVIFGSHDEFTNRFARLIKLVPGVLPLPAVHVRFQPVYVGDVANAIVRTLSDRESAGQRYDLGGPEIIAFGDLVGYLARVIGRPTRVIGLGKLLSSVQANILEYVPGKPFSRDNLRSMQEDSVCTQTNGLERLGITPTPMRVIVPAYLNGRNVRQRYYGYRAAAKRD
jgi:uncharacterized protein YbjT (DUF2867 family)